MGVTSVITNRFGERMMKYGICINDTFTDKINDWSHDTGLARARLLQRICEDYLESHDRFEIS